MLKVVCKNPATLTVSTAAAITAAVALAVLLQRRGDRTGATAAAGGDLIRGLVKAWYLPVQGPPCARLQVCKVAALYQRLIYRR